MRIRYGLPLGILAILGLGYLSLAAYYALRPISTNAEHGAFLARIDTQIATEQRTASSEYETMHGLCGAWDYVNNAYDTRGTPLTPYEQRDRARNAANYAQYCP